MSDVIIPAWTIGDRMAKARRAAGITTTAMCDYLGIHRNSCNAYEHDRARPPKAIVRLWAIRCGVPADWLDPSTTWYSDWQAAA